MSSPLSGLVLGGLDIHGELGAPAVLSAREADTVAACAPEPSPGPLGRPRSCRKVGAVCSFLLWLWHRLRGPRFGFGRGTGSVESTGG